MLEFQVQSRDGYARTGHLRLNHGMVETPIFMPVGTYGAVKAMSPHELEQIGAQIILIVCLASPSRVPIAAMRSARTARSAT